MLQKMSSDKIDVFIHQINKPSEWYQALRKTQLKAIAWAHVYPAYYEQREFIKTDNVKRIVFVSKEEYDAYIDSDLICKGTYIFNMLDTTKPKRPRVIEDKEVTYVGSLVPAKGFHALVKIWKNILEYVPDAQLNVIGTGRVYDRNAKLGKYGIAQEDYTKFRKDFFGAVRDINRIIDQGEYDIIHSHLGNRAFLSLIYAKRKGYKVVISHCHSA